MHACRVVKYRGKNDREKIAQILHERKNLKTEKEREKG